VWWFARSVSLVAAVLLCFRWPTPGTHPLDHEADEGSPLSFPRRRRRILPLFTGVRGI
jgi:hypothetical protein